MIRLASAFFITGRPVCFRPFVKMDGPFYEDRLLRELEADYSRISQLVKDEGNQDKYYAGKEEMARIADQIEAHYASVLSRLIDRGFAILETRLAVEASGIYHLHEARLQMIEELELELSEFYEIGEMKINVQDELARLRRDELAYSVYLQERSKLKKLHDMIGFVEKDREAFRKIVNYHK
jgi:hypothetical protein